MTNVNGHSYFVCSTTQIEFVCSVDEDTMASRDFRRRNTINYKS